MMNTKLSRNAGSAPSAVATIESTSPSIRPPRMAPGRLPSPPRMMMMNAFRSGCSPIIGSSLKSGGFLVLFDGSHGRAEPRLVDEEIEPDHQHPGDRNDHQPLDGDHHPEDVAGALEHRRHVLVELSEDRIAGGLEKRGERQQGTRVGSIPPLIGR